MSIADEITRINNAKNTLKAKLNAKNDQEHQITDETIDEYGAFVDSIEGNGDYAKFIQQDSEENNLICYIYTPTLQDGDLETIEEYFEEDSSLIEILMSILEADASSIESVITSIDVDILQHIIDICDMTYDFYLFREGEYYDIQKLNIESTSANSADIYNTTVEYGIYGVSFELETDAEIGETTVLVGDVITFIDTSGTDATASDILDGKTAYVNGELVTGTFEELDTSDATALPGDLIKGETAYVNGQKVTGTFKAYTKLEYIEATGTQYIITDYVPNPNTGYEITYMCGSTNTYEGLFGYSNYGVTPDLRYTVLNDYNYPNNLRIRVKSSNDDNGYVIPATYNEPHTFSVDKNGNYNMDGTTTGQMEGFEASNTSPIYIFGIRQANGGVGNLGKFKLYKFKIFENDTLVHYFIPVKDLSGVACLFDRITGKFHYNAGTGTFNYYAQLEYIESTGTQYIDTGYNPYKTKMEIKFQVPDVTSRQVGYITAVWNADNNRYMPLAYINDGTENVFRSRDRFATGYDLAEANTNEHILIYNDENHKIIYDNVEKGTIEDLTIQTSKPIYLFASNGSSGVADYTKARIIYVKIWDKNTNTLVRDLIPTKRSDNVICMYDKITKTFYTNAGSGTFTAGPEI